MLLSELVDYAGLFPPAKLDMAVTVANYANYLGSLDAWALGRLIVPATRLSEFEQHAEGHLPTGGDGTPWRLTALVGYDNLDNDLQRLADFNEKYTDRAQVLVIELRATSADDIDDALDRIPDHIFPFFEVAVTDDPRGLIAAIAGSDAGAKVRTGGVAAAAYPSPEQLARFIAASASAGVPFKATAGLHHPLRHFSEAVGTDEFGFLNVFTAGILARTTSIDEHAIAAVLVDQSPESFDFVDDQLRYRGQTLGVDAIRDAREKFAISYGSCSFTEPLADLRCLNLLAATSL
jgi:hypothetical protein